MYRERVRAEWKEPLRSYHYDRYDSMIYHTVLYVQYDMTYISVQYDMTYIHTFRVVDCSTVLTCVLALGMMT